MKSSVIIFPGSNCDRDMDVALKKFGFENQMVWHNDSEIPKSDLIVLPAVQSNHFWEFQNHCAKPFDFQNQISLKQHPYLYHNLNQEI